MADRILLDEIEGDVRFHHLPAELWVLEPRRRAPRRVVFDETDSFPSLFLVELFFLVEKVASERSSTGGATTASPSRVPSTRR